MIIYTVVVDLMYILCVFACNFHNKVRGTNGDKQRAQIFATAVKLQALLARVHELSSMYCAVVFCIVFCVKLSTITDEQIVVNNRWENLTAHNCSFELHP